MYKAISNKLYLTVLLLVLLFGCGARQVAFCGQVSDAMRLNELRRLRDELKLTDSLRHADVTVVMSEHTIMEAAKQIVGLEILMSNGGVLRITSVDGELKPAAAIVKIGVQARSTVTVDLSLTGRLGTGEIRDGVFQMPFQITDVSLASGRLSALFLRTLLGGWLSSKKWNEELPPLEIPLEIDEAIEIPASHIAVDGSPPMEISTPAYRSPLRFTITSLFVLAERLVLGLQMVDNSDAGESRKTALQTSSTASGASGAGDLHALEKEIARLSDNLVSNGDLTVRLDRRVISRLLEQIAAAHRTDFDLRLKAGRVRAEEVTAVVKVLNYTDVESGEGHADVSSLSIDRIADGKVDLRLSLQGEADARMRGREYGIPYRLSPHTTFAVKDKIVPLQFVSDDERVILRAVPGTSLPISLRFSIKVAGRDVGINRDLVVQIDRWLNRIEIPSFFGREFSLPQKMEVDAGGNIYVTSKRKINFKLSKMRVIAHEGGVNMTAAVAFSF